MSARKYIWTAEHDEMLREAYRFSPGKEALSTRLAKLTAALGWPRHIVNQRAQRLGIARDVRRPWSEAEVRFLDLHAGKMTAPEIAKALRRTRISVLAKLGSNYYRTAGEFIADEVSAIFGVTWQRVQQWRRSGWLVPSHGDWYTREDLLRFMLDRPEAFDPRTVEVAFLRGALREAGTRLRRNLFRAAQPLRRAA